MTKLNWERANQRGHLREGGDYASGHAVYFCCATTAAGLPCRNQTKRGFKLCGAHAPRKPKQTFEHRCNVEKCKDRKVPGTEYCGFHRGAANENVFKPTVEPKYQVGSGEKIVSRSAARVHRPKNDNTLKQ